MRSEKSLAGCERRTPMKESAIKKLNAIEDNAENAKRIIAHLMKRCNEDEGFAEDVLKEAKTWDGCWQYVVAQAKKHAKNGCACIEETQVYEWAEDYFRKADDPKPEAKKPATKKPSTSGGQKREAEPKPVSTESGQYSLF